MWACACVSFQLSEASLLTGCRPEILLVFQDTSEVAWTSRLLQRCSLTCLHRWSPWCRQQIRLWFLSNLLRSFLLCFVKEKKSNPSFPGEGNPYIWLEYGKGCEACWSLAFHQGSEYLGSIPQGRRTYTEDLLKLLPAPFLPPPPITPIIAFVWDTQINFPRPSLWRQVWWIRVGLWAVNSSPNAFHPLVISAEVTEPLTFVQTSVC